VHGGSTQEILLLTWRNSSIQAGVFVAARSPKRPTSSTTTPPPANRPFYAGSTFLCTPSALAQGGGTALGAQAGPTAFTQVLHDAGFEHVRIAAETPFNYVFEAR
jgi:hypothetical protein